MIKIYKSLAMFMAALLFATLTLGLWLRSVDIRDPADVTAQRWATIHRLSGVLTGLAVVLVNCIVATYFIGTSRWCKEVSEIYSLSGEDMRQSTFLKRKTFPLAVGNMLIVVGIIALGGAADPTGTFRMALPAGVTWRDFHLLAAMMGTCLICWLSFLQARNIAQNHRVIESVMTAVGRIRQERGLEH